VSQNSGGSSSSDGDVSGAQAADDSDGEVLGVQDNGDEITDEELRDLLAQAKQALLDLVAQIGGENDYRSCSYVWTRDLGQGAQGADVMNLQKFLNMNTDTRVALSGVGSAGQETSYYGPLTAAAVNKFQSKHASQILTPLSLTQPTGYFGGSSRAQSRVLCASDNN
jgi:peptidoglycan hydrolase-like protein with peptidoglycan-binding domain